MNSQGQGQKQQPVTLSYKFESDREAERVMRFISEHHAFYRLRGERAPQRPGMVHWSKALKGEMSPTSSTDLELGSGGWGELEDKADNRGSGEEHEHASSNHSRPGSGTGNYTFESANASPESFSELQNIPSSKRSGNKESISTKSSPEPRGILSYQSFTL